MLLKPSAELLAAVGAKAESEFQGKLAAIIALCAVQSSTIAALTKRIDESEEMILGLADHRDSSSITESRVKEIANAEAKTVFHSGLKTLEETAAAAGSRVAAEALGATGNNPVRASAPAPEISPAKAAEAKGDFVAQWNADRNLQAEFPTSKSYVAFMRAHGAGAVHIKTK